MRIVVVGGGSMIGRVLRRHVTFGAWTFLSHAEALADSAALAQADGVLNLAYNPRLKTDPYSETLDIDLQLAQRLADGRAHYIMASTRMVYPAYTHAVQLSESVDPCPTTGYGAAKLQTERRVGALLGQRLTIIRLSNIFDVSEADGERRSFFGLALRRLRSEGQIVYDMNPAVQRDFLPATIAAQRLATIAKHPVPGIFNLGAGFGVQVGAIAKWLIDGFGEGRLVVTNDREFDAFWLDVSKATKTWNFPAFQESELRQTCLSFGATLRETAGA